MGPWWSFFSRVPGYGGVAGGTLRRAEGDASLGLGGAEQSSRVAKKLWDSEAIYLYHGYRMFSWGNLYTNNPQLSPSCGLIAMVILIRSNYMADVKLGWICPTFFGIMAMVLWWYFLVTSTAPPAPNQEGEGPTEELAEVGFFTVFQHERLVGTW